MMDSRNVLVCFLLVEASVPSFQQNINNSTVLQSFIDVEGNRIYKYIFNNLINKEPEVSNSNTAGGLETGDQIISDDETDTSQRLGARKLIEYKTMLWPHRTVPYSISNKFNSEAKAKIIAGIRHWESVTCLTFVPIQDISSGQWTKLGHRNFLNIVNGNGCSSYVGFQHKNGQTVNLNQHGCMKIRTILHEIGHALGFYHEQNRSDRDEHIEVNLDNVKSSYRGNFAKFPSQNNVTYDYNSVMHYGRKYFSSNELDTMIAKDQNLGFLLGNDEDMTFYDIKTANLAYECDSKCSEAAAITCDNDGFPNRNCNCYCPDVLEGDHCENMASYLYKEECGSRIVMLGVHETFTLKSPNYPAAYPNNIKCGWIVKSPRGTNMTITVKLNDIPRNSRSHKCYHSLELRYNLIGQYGPRLCGTTDHLLHLRSTGNIAMVILHADNDYYGIGFEITFSTGQYGSVCIPNPCPDAVQVCQETGLGGYLCKCPAHLQGPDCNVVNTITCNFDVSMGPEELCLFSQRTNDDLNWRTKEGPTASAGTGPEDDITGGGSYLYIEASSPAKTGDKAVLTSAEISGGIKCLSFFYHMFGSYTGKLQVLVHSVTKTYEWLKSGEQGDEWIEANIDLKMNQNFIVEIVAVRGTGYKSDIAIDSVHLTTGECEQGSEIVLNNRDLQRTDTGVIDDSFQACPAHLLGANCDHIRDVWCDFDDGSDNAGWCVFNNISNNDLNWTRYKGETGTDYTGPSSDATGSGYYLYVDATEPAKQGDTARIATLLIQDGHKCVEFFFHMYGDEQNMGTLNVSFIDTEGNLHSVITSRNHGNIWHHCRISVRSTHMFYIVFSYSVGSGFRGDVAIDNFSVAHGACTLVSNMVSLPDNQDGHSNQEELFTFD